MSSSLEKTFVRGPSPSYSEEATSDNGMSPTLPIGGEHQTSSENFIARKKYDEQYRNALKGRNTFAFWTIVTLLLVLTVGNLILTLTIIGVLHLGKGIQGMELIPEEGVIKFYGSTDMDRIYNKWNGQIDGFVDEPVSITGDDSTVTVRVNRNGQLHSRLTLDKSGVSFKGINSFEVKDPNTGEAVFTTHRPHYNIPDGAESLDVKAISASRIASPIGKPLTIHSDSKIAIRGSEGMHMDGQNILLQSEGNIVFNSTQGATILNAAEGIFLDMEKIPTINSEFGIRAGRVQYILCVCMPQGRLFRVPVPRIHNGPKITCMHFNPKDDPCA